ncbi:MAG: hypothetical protein WCS37_22630 [Chloroflexota bacterium]|nr:hypothetical protein [Chloroflexota bacterium]
MATTLWRYLTLTIDYNTFLIQLNGQTRQLGDLNQLLDQLGRDGWELVAVVQNAMQPNLWGFFFKQPLLQ